MLRTFLMLAVPVLIFINSTNVDAGNYRIYGTRQDIPWLDSSTYDFKVIEEPRYDPLDFATNDLKRAQTAFFKAQTELYRYQLERAKEIARQEQRDRWAAEAAQRRQQEAEEAVERERQQQARNAEGKALVEQALRKGQYGTALHLYGEYFGNATVLFDQLVEAGYLNELVDTSYTNAKLKPVGKPRQSVFAKGKALANRVLGKDKKKVTRKAFPANTKSPRFTSIPQVKHALASELGYSNAETNKAAFLIYQGADKPNVTLDAAVAVYLLPLTRNDNPNRAERERALELLNMILQSKED